MDLRIDVKKRFKDFVLDVQLPFAGQTLGVFGPSGSGKTTLLHCLSGFLSPDAGQILMDGACLFPAATRSGSRYHRRRHRIGYVFQEALLFPHLTVRQNVFYGAASAAQDEPLTKDILAVLHLLPLLDRMPMTLSGGEQKRVALARVLLSGPELLLCDEPLSSLDWPSRYRILLYLKEVQALTGLSVVFVSHSVSELLILAEQVAVLEQGRIKTQGEVSALLLRPDQVIHDDEGIENILVLKVRSVDRDAGTLLLDLGGQALRVPWQEDQIRPNRHIGIRANDIILAVRPPEGISARNVIPAHIEKILLAGSEARLRVMVGTVPLFVELTGRSCQELELKEGQAIFLIIKSRAIRFIDA